MVVAARTIEEAAIKAKLISEVYEKLLRELYGWMTEANVDNESTSYEYTRHSILEMADNIVATRRFIEDVIYEAYTDIENGVHIYEKTKPESKTVQVSGMEVDYDDIPF